MMSKDIEQLLEQARQWIEIDPDVATRRELEELVQVVQADPASTAADDLADRFSGTLQFGTAGLRAALGAGPMRMNQVVVSRAAAGLALYASHRAEQENWDKKTAVVGFDARYNSDVFARLTAEIFTAAGIETTLMPSPLPTPVLAWATKEFNAEIGVMVTASHNPANDNGYKVYLGGNAVPKGERGSQIVPPYDAQIAAAIVQATESGTIDRAERGWKTFPATIASDYAERVSALVPATERDLKIVYTPVHGVGAETAVDVLARAGFTDVHVVKEQAQPDPDFPTAAFPNPEEPGVLDLAIDLAQSIDADLVIANDPDADRAAFAVKDGAHWRMLRGDEAGAIFGAIMLNKIDDTESTVFANSIVSSRLLGAIARSNGIKHVETLTGFKWISRVENLTYGYEEALGYCVDPANVQDKDGISAALIMAEFAQEVKARGGALTDVLEDLASEYGLYATDQLSVRVDDLSRIKTMMSTLRAKAPESLGGSPVVDARDLAQGSADLPPTDGLLYLTQDNTRVIVRPSGTEPKLKCYIEVIRSTENGLDEARQEATQLLATIKNDLSEALGLNSKEEPVTELSSQQLAGMIDHTILAPNASEADVLRLCAEAREHGFASVCVNPVWASVVAKALEGSKSLPCVVVGFPFGASASDVKAFEAKTAVEAGAREVDMVINIADAIAENRDALVADIRAVAEATHAGGAGLKVIIETSYLSDAQKVLACEAAVEAGADFVKTSTGYSSAGATVEDIALMRKTVGPNVGVKASGGIRDRATALAMIEAGASRIGASKGIEIIGAAQATAGDNY